MEPFAAEIARKCLFDAAICWEGARRRRPQKETRQCVCTCSDHGTSSGLPSPYCGQRRGIRFASETMVEARRLVGIWGESSETRGSELVQDCVHLEFVARRPYKFARVRLGCM